MRINTSSSSISTMSEAEAYASNYGVTLSPTDRERIARNQQAELTRLMALSKQEKDDGWLVRANAAMPRVLDSIVGVGDVLMTITRTLIISFGIPVVLVLLLIVEQQRVVHGIGLFEANANLAAFAAWSLVILNLVLEFLVEYVESKQPDSAIDTRFSLRIWMRKVGYFLGLGNNWTPEERLPSTRYRTLQRIVTLTILVLALSGSMVDVIRQQDGPWYMAVVSIFSESDLSLMSTWLGGLLFALAAILSAQALSRYVAQRYMEINSTSNGIANNSADISEQHLEGIGVQYILAKVAEVNRRREEKKQAKVTPFSSNGTGELT